MLIILTSAINKNPIAVDHALILTVSKKDLLTQVQTGIQTPKGAISFDVYESVEEVVRLSYEAQGLKPPEPRVANLAKS